MGDALSKVRRQRRWTRKRVVQGFRVLAHGHPAAVVDVCYGGLRLEVSNVDELPTSFDVEVGGIGLHFEVDRVGVSHVRRPVGRLRRRARHRRHARGAHVAGHRRSIDGLIGYQSTTAAQKPFTTLLFFPQVSWLLGRKQIFEISGNRCG